MGSYYVQSLVSTVVDVVRHFDFKESLGVFYGLKTATPRFPGRYKSFTDSLLCIALLSRIISLVVLSASFRSLIFQLALHIWHCERDSVKVFVPLIVRGTESPDDR